MNDPQIRQEALLLLSRIVDGNPAKILDLHARALIDMADELDRLTLDAEDQSWREALAAPDEPHAPTVAAALREVANLAEPDISPITRSVLLGRACEIEEGREDG
jgi:hypothetical protein